MSSQRNLDIYTNTDNAHTHVLAYKPAHTIVEADVVEHKTLAIHTPTQNAHTCTHTHIYTRVHLYNSYTHSRTRTHSHTHTLVEADVFEQQTLAILEPVHHLFGFGTDAVLRQRHLGVCVYTNGKGGGIHIIYPSV